MNQLYLGVNDASAGTQLPTKQNNAQAKFKFYGQSPMGPIDTPMEVGAPELLNIFGIDLTDTTAPWYLPDHAAMHDIISSPANIIFERITDTNLAGPSKLYSTFCLIAELKTGDINARLSTGEIVAGTTTPGQYWDISFGQKVFPRTEISLTGAPQVYDLTTATTRVFPLFTMVSDGSGTKYSEVGVKLGSLPDVTKAMSNGEFNYDLSVYRPTRLKDMFKSDSERTSLGLNSKDLSGMPIKLDSMINRWINLTDTTLPIVNSGISEIIVHDRQVKNATHFIAAEELSVISTTPTLWNDGLYAASWDWFDIPFKTVTEIDTAAVIDSMINFIGLKSSKGVEYMKFRRGVGPVGAEAAGFIDNEIGTDGIIRFNPDPKSDLWLHDYGRVGMSFYRALGNKFDSYTNPDFVGNNVPLNKESIFLDCGYPWNVKKSMLKVLAGRNDCVLLMTAFYYDYNTNTPDERTIPDLLSMGTLIHNEAMLYPESVWFGTETCRVYIESEYGRHSTLPYAMNIPSIFDLAEKISKHSGAGNGIRKTTLNWSKAANKDLTTVKIKTDPLPPSLQKLFHSRGIGFTIVNDKRRRYRPGTYTVFGDKTSVLSSLSYALGITTVVKGKYYAEQAMEGDDTLNKGAFLAEYRRVLESRLNNDIFDGELTILLEPFYSAADAASNNSVSLKVTLSGTPPMKNFTSFIIAKQF